MENDNGVDLEKSLEKVYEDGMSNLTPSCSPAPSYGRSQLAASALPQKSCAICRNTLMLSYFSCCAVCGNVIECGRSNERLGSERGSSSAPQLPTTSSAEGTDCSKKLHCSSAYCKYTHNVWLLRFFILFEAMPAVGALMLLGKAFFVEHDWYFLRFRGLMAVQWWQIFLMPRQWHAGQSILTGQLVATLFMVWFYIEGREAWRWFEPFAVSTILLKILFPW
ncbi:Uu.00g081730.m01.CDS01 [Anthostomella pinea]|uniref:Uu.00g081730.m01.CDS01 n=1 Tax=Anthostomella pinea TaxID=933095 RepID=A0AAI8VLX5_9PEZI|nr:Uu.00g081730.m01.CDS01 [Anthostomella pinea]